MAARNAKRLVPLLDRVLVQKFVPQTRTKAGIMIPERAAGKVMEGTIIATGPGKLLHNGNFIPVGLKAGDRVMLPEYGGTKLLMNDKEYFLFREHDILGKIE